MARRIRECINCFILFCLIYYSAIDTFIRINYKQGAISTCNSAIGGVSHHNFMLVPNPGKWGGKPENPGFYLLLFSSS